MDPTHILDLLAFYGPWVITAAAAAAASVPPGEPGTWWYVARQFIDFLALNFGHAAPAHRWGRRQ